MTSDEKLTENCFSPNTDIARLNRRQRCALFLINGLITPCVFAQLPTPVDPTSGSADGNYLNFMQGWTGDAIDYIALAISGAGFLWVGWILLSKFNEARSSNDPDWGSVGLTAVIAGVLLVIVSYFLNEAVGII